ncbi:hypothetical protein CL633_02420 [bacterium]|nr:hypothetical protein [bacterium]
MTKNLNFSQALEKFKVGGKVARDGWNGKNQYLEIQNPDDYSKMGLPYIYIKTVDNKLVPWIASQSDLLSDDWFYVE